MPDEQGKHRENVLIFGNPRAGSKSGKQIVDGVREELTKRGFSVTYSDEPGSLAQLVTDLSPLVISAGGDGTVDLVANSVPADTPITVLPLGTENLLAKYLGITNSPESVCDVVSNGELRQFDAGCANGRLFLLMFSCGFDAHVVRRLHDSRTGHIHHLSWAKPILASLTEYDFPKLKIQCETESGEWVEHQSHWVFVFNVPAYAAGLQIAPEADPTDGQFDVRMFRGGSLPRGLFHLGTVLFGQHGEWSDCHQQRATRVRIEADSAAPYQVDGDPGGDLPVEIEVLRQRISLVVPQGWKTK